MSDKSLMFKEIRSQGEIEELAKYDIQVFTDSQDFHWSFDNIKKEMKAGWKLYAVNFNHETVAAVFVKSDSDTLFTKNTPIKLAFQGNGFSHQIKDFYEREANRLQVKRVINYCPVDNFRMIALNESHGYQKTGRFLGTSKTILEWEKLVQS
jgi:hypothetical protein